MKYLKLKANNSISAFFIAYILSALVLLSLLLLTASHMVKDAAWGNALASSWQSLLASARQENFLAYAAIRIFPWLLVLWAALFVWERVSGWRKARKTNPITFLVFEETSVLLGHQKAHADVRLPYAETDLSVTIPVMVAYNKYRNPIPLFGLLGISFSYKGKTYSVQHRGKLPFLQKLLDAGKKFRSCSASIERLNDKYPATPDEQHFIQFVEEQLENHRRYGLMLTAYPTPRLLWLVWGLLCLAVMEFFMMKILAFLVKTNAAAFFIIVLCALGAGLLAWAVWAVKRYVSFRTAAQKLQKLYGKLP